MPYEVLYDYRIQLFGLVALRIATRVFGKATPPIKLVLNASFFSALTAVLLYHQIVPYEASPSPGSRVVGASQAIGKTIWWISGSMLLVSLIRLFLVFERTPREGRLLQDVLVGLIFGGTFLSIASNVFNIPVGTLIATSGVFAIVLGLALQNTLADVFSGVALNLGKPYRIGDWVVLDDGIQGRVVETNWRATHLLNGANDLVVVPNSALAKARIVNQSSPDETHGITLKLRMRPTHSPATIEDVMRTVLWSSNHILKHPEPSVRITALDATAVEVELACRVRDLTRTVDAKNELFDLVFRHARASSLAMASTAGCPEYPPTPFTETQSRGTPWRLVNSIAIFAALSDDEKEKVAETLVRRVFDKDTMVVAEGEICHGLFIVRSGVVVVERQLAEKVVELTRLAPHDCFGERSILSGLPETASKRTLTPVVAYEIPSEVLRPILTEKPWLRDQLRALSHRHTEHDHHVMAELAKTPRQQTYSFADRIRHLFDASEDY